MPRLFRFITNSVATRTTCMVLVVTTAIMLTAGIWQMQHVRTIVTEETNRLASRSIDGAISIIDNRISTVETAVATAASYADILATQEDKANMLMEKLIVSDTDIAAVTLLYKANYFPNHGRYYAPTISRNPITGELEEDEIGGPENDFCYLETDSNWIYTNKLDHGYWCLPYIDSMSTKRAMVTYSVPLKDRSGEIYAVLCADVDLRWVQALMEEAKPYSYAKVSVLSRDEKFICHPDSSCILNINARTLAEKLGSPEIQTTTERMLHWERGSDTMGVDMLDTKGQDTGKEKKMIVYFAPIKRVLWSVSFTIPEEKVLEAPNRLRTNMIVLLVVLLVSIFVFLYFIIKAQLKPLEMLAEKTREIAKGDFNVALPAIANHDEIRRLRDSFDEMQHSLSTYIDQLQQATMSKASIESELHVASNIQMSMLPKIFPPYPERNDIDIYGQLKPAKAVGGDLFDFFIRDEKLFFCIGDVSGKGVPASLVMAVTRAQFRTIAAHEAMPDRIITELNEAMAEGNESNMFVTLFVGVLDMPTGKMRFCNAGHDAPILIGNSRTGLLPCDSNIPVGVMPGWKFTVQETTIDPHTTIFLYTDGLTEAENIEHAQFQEKRIFENLSLLENKPDILIKGMTDAVHAFVGEAEQSDDLTMLAIQYKHQQAEIRYQRSISLPNDVQAVPQLAEFVDEVCEAVGFDMGMAMKMNLAIEEAVVNVMNYAYPSGTQGMVNIEAKATEAQLKFIISDKGVPFDPTAKAEVDTTLSAEDRGIGGLGIHLIRQLMDSINYERDHGQNILTLIKKL